MRFYLSSDSFLSLDTQDGTEPELDNKFKVRFRQNVSHAPDVACARLVTLACDCNANGPVNVSAVTRVRGHKIEISIALSQLWRGQGAII